MPSGRLAGSSALLANAGKAIARSLPCTAKRPSAKTSSPSDACKRWAASVRAFASVASIAFTTAAPPMCMERAPPWPAPLFTWPVSAWT